MRIVTSLVVLAMSCLLAGSLDAQIVIGPGAKSPSAALPDTRPTAADLDADGKLDLAVLQSGLTQVRFGDGRGHFGSGLATVPQIGADDIDLGDVDGDGRPDLVAIRVANPAQQFFVMLGLGGADFDLVAISAMPGGAGPGGGSVDLVDADGDGDLDALVFTALSIEANSIVDLFVNDGAGHFTGHVVSSGTRAMAGAAADLNADGLPDVVVSLGNLFQPLAELTHVFLGQPDGSFVSAVTWSATHLVGIADLDRDGVLDVLALDHVLVGARAHLGVGDGSFVDGPLTSTQSLAVRALADFDSDGVLDLLVRTTALPGHDTIRLGDGQGGFAGSDAVAFDMGSSATDFLIADVVPDGRPDIVAASSSSAGSIASFPNLTYPAGGTLLDLGYAKVEALGWPIMLASGDFTAGGAAKFELLLALPNFPTALLAGLSEVYAPFHGGTLVPSPDFVVGPFLADQKGGATVAGHWPAGMPNGTELTLQFWCLEPGLPAFVAASSAVRVTTP